MDRLIYMDNAATTSVKPEVLNSMLPFFTDNYANPSSIYNFAQKSKKAVEDARTTIADIIGADKPNEIYFTAGGSESDNWALKAAAECFKDKGNHIITKITTGNIYFLREKQDKFMEKPEESDYNMFHWRSCSGNCLI